MIKEKACLPLGNLSEPLGDMPGLVIDERFLIFGGGSGEEVRDIIWAVDDQTGACEPVGQMPYPARGHQVVAAENHIYLLGGFDNGTKNDLWRLDLEAGSAESLKPMPSSNAWFAATAHDGKIVLVGGFSIPAGYLDTIAIYDPALDDWAVEKDVFDPTLFPKGKIGANAVLSYENQVLSYGGADTFDTQRGRANATGITGSYNLASKTWEIFPQEIHPREGLIAVRHGSVVYLVGGMPEDTDEPYRPIEKFDLNTHKIHVVAQLATGRLTPAVGIVESRLIVAGGVIEPLFGMTDAIEYVEIGE